MDDLTRIQDYTQNNSVNEIGSFEESVSSVNFIHSTAVVQAGARLGKNNYIGAFCLITKDAIIGDNNRFEAFCSIGTEPEHKGYFGKPNKGVRIGNNNVFREYVTVNSGCEKITVLCDNIVMLRGSHIGHDSIIFEDCVISCNVLIGGHSLLGKGVNMGLGSICHQYSKIGSYAMIGMGAIVTKTRSINCFGVYVGAPVSYLKENDYQKKKFTIEEVNEICQEFEILKPWN